MVYSYFVRLTSFILAFQIGLGSTVFNLSYAQAETPTQNIKAEAPFNYEEFHQTVAEAVMPPELGALDELDKDKDFPKGLAVDPNDSAIDQDPFFLRSQVWKTSSHVVNSSEEIASRQTTSGVQLALPGSSKVWELERSVHPILVTPEFIFFATNPASDIFGADPKSRAEDGQGVFVVSYRELVSKGLEKINVPVYYFPLPGSTWQSTADRRVEAEEVVHRDLVIFKDTQGVGLPVRLKDVRAMVNIETFNLQLASAMTMRGAVEKLGADANLIASLKQTISGELQKVIAASRTGKLDGMDGIQSNIETAMKKALQTVAPGNRIVVPRGSTAAFGMLFTGLDLDQPGRKNGFYSSALDEQSLRKSRVASFLLDLVGLPQAQADSQIQLMAYGSLVILAKCAGVYALSVLARYTILKQKIAERIALPENSLGKNNRQIELSVFGQSLTTLAQSVFVWPTNVIEFLMDKSPVRISETNRLRKVFNWSFGYARATSNRTPVNWKTVIYGVGILGLGDTILVFGQQMWLNEMIARSMAHVFPILQSRVDAAWTGHNTATIMFNVMTVMYCLAGYFTEGAFQAAHTVQDIVTQDAIQVVGSRMNSRGMDPMLPENKTEFEAEKGAYVKSELRRRDFPGNEAFLFDANSLYRNIQEVFGYSAPSRPDIEDKDAREKAEDAENYYAFTRQGQMGRALKRAIEEAKRLGNVPDVVRFLEEKREDFSLMNRFLKNPRSFGRLGMMEVARRWRSVRRDLTPLTSSTTATLDLEDAELVPGWVGEARTAVAKKAASLFRHEVLRLTGAIPEDEVKAAKPKEYDPARAESWFARRQINAALTRTHELFINAFNRDPANILADPNETALQEEWNKIYRTQLLKQVGLYPDVTQVTLIETVEKNLESEYKGRLEKEPEFANYLSGLEPAERARIEGIYKTDLFGQIYINLVVNQEAAPMTAAAQPGIFQRIRQSKFVRGETLMGQIANRALRFAESTFSQSNYERGLKNMLYRNTPALGDIVNANIRGGRRFIPSLLFRYPYLKSVWNAAMPVNRWGASQVMNGTVIGAPWQFTDRMIANQGWKPNKNWWGMALYTIIGSFATSGMGILFPMFEKDVLKVVDPIVNGVKAAGPLIVDTATHACTFVMKSMGM